MARRRPLGSGDDSHSRTVYRSGEGPVRREDPPRPRVPRGDGVVRVAREVAGRRGKPVTAIRGVPLPADELEALAAALKRRCGAGGTAKEGVIEIQGDHRDAVIAELEARGYAVKRAGG